MFMKLIFLISPNQILETTTCFMAYHVILIYNGTFFLVSNLACILAAVSEVGVTDMVSSSNVES